MKRRKEKADGHALSIDPQHPAPSLFKKGFSTQFLATMNRLALLSLVLASSTEAFVPSLFARPTNIGAPSSVINHAQSSSVALRMSDFYFPSAMPEKPQLTMEEKIEESADQFVDTMTVAMGPGIPPPPELEALREARSSGASAPELALKIYELMIERGMLYDEDPDTGILTPTDFNIKENLDVPEVKNEFANLYKYGVMLMNRGMLTADEVKNTVMKRLIKRTGLTPEEFDKWLGY